MVVADDNPNPICGADTHRPIPIKFGMRVAPRNVIIVSNFCNKIFRGFRSTVDQNPRFPLTLLVIVVIKVYFVPDQLLLPW